MEGRTHRVVAKMRIELGMEDEAGPSNTQQQRSTPPPSRLSTLNKELEMVLATLPGKNVQTPALY